MLPALADEVRRLGLEPSSIKRLIPCVVLLLLLGCQSRSTDEMQRSGDHALISGWTPAPETLIAEAKMRPMWNAYCAWSAEQRKGSVLYAILANEFLLACHRDYPKDDSNVCGYVRATAGITCDYAL